MASLENLKDVFLSMNESITAMGTSFNTQLVELNKTNASILEETKIQREALSKILGIEKERDKPKTDTSFVPPAEEPKVVTDDAPVKSAATAAGEEWGSLLTSFNGLLAGAAALGLAFAGLRGWEGKIIDYVKDGLGSLKNSIIGGLKSIKTNIFFAFGLDDAGKVLPNSALDDLLKTPIMEKITFGLSKILAPLKMMGDFLSGLFTGTGGDAATGKTVKFLGEIGDNVGAFAQTIGKILKPIGLLFSAYDAVMAFMNTEGTIMDKLVAGLGGFLGDFIGAPLDLLKSIVGWAMSQFGFENAAEFLEGFSFETLINDIINGIWDMVKSAGEWVGTLFTDPVAALTESWNAMYGENGIIDMLFMPVSMAIDWITKKFGWRDEDAPPFDLYEIVSGFVSSTLAWAGEKLTTISDTLSEGFDEFVEYITTIPDRIKFAAEGMFIDVAARLEKGFILFGDWIASIPARIKVLALSAINSALSGLPEWAQIVSAEDVAAAQAAVTERSANTTAKLEDLDKRTEAKKLDLEERMANSGIYNSVAAATAESPINSVESERIRMQKEQEAVSKFQPKLEAVSSGDSRMGAQINAINANSGNTDARSSTVIAPTIISPQYGGGRDRQDRYGLNWAN